MKRTVHRSVLISLCKELDVDPNEVSRMRFEPNTITVEIDIPVVGQAGEMYVGKDVDEDHSDT